MPAYITKIIRQTFTDNVIRPTGKTRIMQDTDKADPTPEVDDESYGGLGDETGTPEDESEIFAIEEPNLLYCNRNPRGDPCPDCRRLLGTVWKPGNQPRVPQHDHCYCYYQKTWSPVDGAEKRFASDPRNQARPDKKML